MSSTVQNVYDIPLNPGWFKGILIMADCIPHIKLGSITMYNPPLLIFFTANRQGFGHCSLHVLFGLAVIIFRSFCAVSFREAYDRFCNLQLRAFEALMAAKVVLASAKLFEKETHEELGKCEKVLIRLMVQKSQTTNFWMFLKPLKKMVITTYIPTG